MLLITLTGIKNKLMLAKEVSSGMSVLELENSLKACGELKTLLEECEATIRQSLKESEDLVKPTPPRKPAGKRPAKKTPKKS